jgi:hypothetical protein
MLSQYVEQFYARELMSDPNAASAARMFVTQKAVSKYSDNIFAKLVLQQAKEDNRRVLAVLAYLQA